MKSIIRYIPNTLTCFNLVFGFYASILGLSGDFFGAMIAIFIAAVFDFSDGLAARLLKAYSDIGKELDSLADVVSFGVAPGMMLYCFINKLLNQLSWNESLAGKVFLLSAFAIPVFSALRLAKFNIDDRQKTSFLGLPVPAHAILWSSLLTAFSPAVLLTTGDFGFFPFSRMMIQLSPVVLLISFSITAVATSLLLVSEIPMFSLKVSSLAWRKNILPYTLLLSAILFITSFGVIGVTATILLYIILSLLTFR
jgi:CDP-diacylglycerol--serine O-phosphatidyltransferase